MTTYWSTDAPPAAARPETAWRDQVTRREEYEQANPHVRIRCIAGWWKAWPPGCKTVTRATLGGLLDALGAP